MDPLSITTGCVGLIATVAHTTKCITKFVVDCRDAQKDLAAVSRELSDLEMTLHILKNDVDTNKSNQLPENLRKRICAIMGNCDSVLGDLDKLITKYEGGGIERNARWALSGKKEVDKIRSSLEAHKSALSLVVEATTLHMSTVITAGTNQISMDTSLIKEYTMKIVEQLAKQDEILEQIAWIRAVVSQRPAVDSEKTLVMDGYLDSLTDYAESLAGDSITDEIAEEVRRLSLESVTVDDSGANHGPAPVFTEEDDFMTIVIGNTHRGVEAKPLTSRNKHLWSFYIRASGEEIIEEVLINLHPTFFPQQVRLKSPPYKVTRIGWGIFIINVLIVLKPGYIWREVNARQLPLQWMLDFEGVGQSQSGKFMVVAER
ncbi:hypothetical protein BX600DRAFT_553601 [Xylariales sp. PMI_506]|nr:hypothetical protein BX600DRAFT_553601 [Xylariales sp. PMI_506]